MTNIHQISLYCKQRCFALSNIWNSIMAFLLFCCNFWTYRKNQEGWKKFIWNKKKKKREFSKYSLLMVESWTRSERRGTRSGGPDFSWHMTLWSSFPLLSSSPSLCWVDTGELNNSWVQTVIRILDLCIGSQRSYQLMLGKILWRSELIKPLLSYLIF